MYKKPAILAYSLLLFLMSGCSKNSGSKVVTFINDFEGQKGWCNMENIYEGKGHSGRFCNVTSSTSPYGSIFRIKFKDIDKEPLTYLRFSVWCYAESLPTAGRLVLSVDSDTSQSVIWHGWPLVDFITDNKKWVEVTGELDLTEKGANNPENTFVFYLWNNEKDAIFGDDFYFEFSKK